MREPLEVPKALAEKLGYYAMQGFIDTDSVGERPTTIEGWTLLHKSEEGQKYGYLLTGFFHREGDPPEEAWSAVFDVQSDNEIFTWGNNVTFTPRTKVVRVVEVTTWE